MGCHIIMTEFLEMSVFGQGTLLVPHKKGVFFIVYISNIKYVLWRWQRCNLFVKKRAGISAWYKTFPGIYSANCCITSSTVVKSERDVRQLRRNSGRVWAVRRFKINFVLQSRIVRRPACHYLLKRLCKHSAINTIVLHKYPKQRTLKDGNMWDRVNTKYILLPSSSDFVLLFKRASWCNCIQYFNTRPPSWHRLMSLLNGFNTGFPLKNKEPIRMLLKFSSK